VMKIANIIAFVIMIVMNYLANALPLNNRTTGEISNSFPNLFVPAGITFSIWGVIYILLLAFCIIQFRAGNESVISLIGWLFAVTCLLNASWIVFWHYGKLPLSLFTMIALLVILIMINTRISSLPFGLIKISFGIYLGWICIATIANVTALLVHYDWRGWGISEEHWTIIMILAGLIISSLTMINLKNPFVALSVIWAFTGIIIKRHYDYRSIVITAAAGIVVLVIVMGYSFLRQSTAQVT
jgi:hypothetical protein